MGRCACGRIPSMWCAQPSKGKHRRKQSTSSQAFMKRFGAARIVMMPGRRSQLVCGRRGEEAICATSSFPNIITISIAALNFAVLTQSHLETPLAAPKISLLYIVDLPGKNIFRRHLLRALVKSRLESGQGGSHTIPSHRSLHIHWGCSCRNGSRSDHVANISCRIQCTRSHCGNTNCTNQSISDQCANIVCTIESALLYATTAASHRTPSGLRGVSIKPTLGRPETRTRPMT